MQVYLLVVWVVQVQARKKKQYDLVLGHVGTKYQPTMFVKENSDWRIASQRTT